MLYANIIERINVIMKKTRNIFVLTGSKQDVQVAMDNIQFKGVTVLPHNDVSMQSISDVLSNNKSVVCSQNPPCCFSPIEIEVINDKNSSFKDGCIINISLGDIAGQFRDIADKLNCDIGDHKSNSSGLTEAPKPADCSYCKYLHKGIYSGERTIYSSDHFFVMPTLGEFIPGYLLIIPYQHVMSNAELDLPTQKELLDVIEDISYLLKLTYGRFHFLVWENGTGNSGRGKAKDSIVHAHTHIAPSTLTAKAIEKLSGFHFEEISTEELSEYNQYSYLLVKNSANTWKISNNPGTYIPRQYVRQLLADEYDIPGEQWNWRTFPFREQMMQTYYDMADAIRKHWNSLPDRIKANTRAYV